MIKYDINKSLEKIINDASSEGFKEIIIEPNKDIYFLKFINNKLEKQIYNKINVKNDVNTISNFVQSLVGIDNKDKENFINTFLTPTNKILCRSYTFKNQNERVINIKILDHEIEKFSNYINEMEIENINKKEIYKNILEVKTGGIVIISSQTENVKKNFYYSIIEEINNAKVSKILSFEYPIERIISNKNSFIFQSKFQNDSIDYVRFLNPDYVFIDKHLNKEILIDAINMANSGIKVFISTNNTDFDKNIIYTKDYLKGEILGFETFEKIFKYFIIISNQNKKTFIHDIKSISDIEF